VGFPLITRVASSGSSSERSPATATSAASAAPGVTATPDASAAAPSTTTPASSATAPSATAPSVAPETAPPVDPAAEAAAAGEFVARPGLPPLVVRAYADNKVVVLLVVRRLGIDHEAVRRMVEQQGSESVAVL
jgi:hypothetical protein